MGKAERSAERQGGACRDGSESGRKMSRGGGSEVLAVHIACCLAKVSRL